MERNYDFCGWVTRNDLRCSDGRTIRKDAFAHCDGIYVPLVWNHLHNDPENVLGKVLLKNRPEGVRGYGYFNDTERGCTAKAQVVHGDIQYLSIYANHLKQNGGDVLHGDIREVSLVLAGANPGAYIDDVIEHGEFCEGEAILYTDDFLMQSDDDSEDEEEKNEEPVTKTEEPSEEKDGEVEHSDKDTKEEKKDMADGNNSEKTVKEVFDTLNEEQKTVVYALIGQAVEDAKAEMEGGDEEDEEVKHNVFDTDEEMRDDVLSHADQEEILRTAKSSGVGSLRAAIDMFAESRGMELQHDDLAPAGGFVQPPTQGNISMLFPEYAEVRPGAPEIIRNDNEWVSKVLNKIHKSPISRIRVTFNDIRDYEEQLRAKGYEKGKKKSLTGNMALIRRTVDPQTIYVKNALHRDDIVDITDFDYVDYLYKIDRSQYEMELARAILIGDGRDISSEDKISEDHVKSIWNDDELFTMHVDLDKEATLAELQGSDTGKYFGDNFITSESMVNACLYARENYKGTGSPDMYITPHMLNVMLLARDRDGRRLYSGVAELATALNVASIITVEQFANKTRTAMVGGVEKTKKLLALICNLSDYSLGATKGGQLTHFNQFDIDFNQQKSLLEGRQSGMLVRVQSAIAIEEEVNF